MGRIIVVHTNNINITLEVSDQFLFFLFRMNWKGYVGGIYSHFMLNHSFARLNIDFFAPASFASIAQHEISFPRIYNMSIFTILEFSAFPLPD